MANSDHWLAQHLLKNFRSPTGELYQLSVSTGAIRAVEPQDVECAKGYDPPEYRLVIQEIESNGTLVARYLRKEISRRGVKETVIELDKDKLQHCFRYIALSYLRTPRRRMVYENPGHPLRDVESVAADLKQHMDFVCVRMRGDQFLLGDNPVQIVTQKDEMLFEEDGVINHPKCLLVFPVSKDRVFVGSPDLGAFRSIAIPKRVSIVNSAQIYGADQHVYGCSEEMLRRAYGWRRAALSNREEIR
jgi:hypothetical protein